MARYDMIMCVIEKSESKQKGVKYRERINHLKMVRRRYETDVANWIVGREEFRRRIEAVTGAGRGAEMRIENYTLDPSKWILMVNGRRERRGEELIRKIMEEEEIDIYEYRKHPPMDLSQPPAWITVKGKKVERIF
ncbi:MAG: hypothetical protein PWR13_238 [Archaeoglobi archaeon]|nr:hypothetical protein [Archaeoglobi archaeon]MDK2781210.1 hypothetical protein [Archaeoglobi archaeon]